VDGQQTALSEKPHWSPTPLLISALSLLASDSTPRGDLEIKVLTDLSAGLQFKFQNDITGMVPAIQKGDLAVQRVLHVALQNLITKIFFCL